LFKTESYTKGAVLSVIFNAAAKLVQFLNIFIIASLFGASTETDLYYFLFNFVTIVIATFVSSIDSTVLIPEFIRLRDSGNIKKAIGFINKYLLIYFSLGFIVFIIGYFFSISIFSLLSNFGKELLQQNKTELILSLFLILLIITSNLLTSILTTYKYFTIPNVVAFVNSILSLVFLLFFYKKYGIVSAMVGIVVGYLINAILLVGILIKKVEWNFLFIDTTYDKRITKFIGASQATAFIVALRAYATQFLLSGFGGGVLTAINWGNQIGSLGEVFINSQLYTIAGIKLSEFYTTNKKEAAVKLFYSLTTLLVTIGSIMFVILFTSNAQIAEIINFKHKFTKEVLIVLSSSIVFLNVIPSINIFSFISTKILASFQCINFKVVRFSLIGQIVLLIAIWVGIKWGGYNGYFVASIIGFFIIATLYLLLVKNYFTSFSILTLVKKNLHTIVLCSISILVIEGLKYLKWMPNFNKFIYVSVISIFVTAVFAKKLFGDFKLFKNTISE
jgi:putative peptidoglycan lipid II flippase